MKDYYGKQEATIGALAGASNVARQMQPRLMGEIEREVASAAKASDAALLALEALTNRLRPILVERESTKAPAEVRETVETPLGNELREIAIRMEIVVDRLNAVNEKLAL